MFGNRFSLSATFSRHISGLTFQLFVLIFLPLTILLLLITFGSIALHQAAMQTMVGERDERAVSAVAQGINDHIYFRLQVLSGIANRASQVPDVDLQSILSSSNELIVDFDGGMAFMGEDSAVLAATGNLASWDGQFIRESLFTDSNIKTGLHGYISEPVPNGEGSQLILVGSPLLDRRSFAVGAVSINNLVDRILAGSLPLDSQINIFLGDKNRRLIYHKGQLDLPSPVESHPGVLQALNGESGITYRSEGELEKVVIYRQVPLTGWALVVEEPWEAATSPLLRTTVFAPLVLVPVLFLALVALAFVTRQIVQPMHALAEKTSNLSWGEFESIKEPVGGILEIRHLQAGLNHLAQKVQSAQQNLHSYIGAITAGQEEERRRLARELHDDTIQALIALKQRVQLLQFDGANEGINHSLSELENLTEQTVENLRRMTRNLRPIYLEDLGLVLALDMLSNEVEKQNAIPVQFNRIGVERRLPPAIELAIYRIAQESLNNVVQHSHASRAVLTLAFSQEDVWLDIIDNGKGFQVPPSPADFATEGHFGLLGIHERAELIGAVLSVKSSNHQGTHVHISLPLRKISNFDVDKELEIR